MTGVVLGRFLIAAVLYSRIPRSLCHTTIMRTVRNLNLAVDDVPIQDVQFQSRR